MLMRNSKRWRELLAVLAAISLAVAAVATMAYLIPGYFDDSIDFFRSKLMEPIWE